MAKKTKYVFNSKEVRRCIHHAVSSSRWTRWADPKFNSEGDNLSDAALVIVEDYSGVYIVSAGQPRDRLRNKKIYSAYARGTDNNPQEYLSGSRSTHLSNMESVPSERIGCVGVIYLSIGENGHVYEELLTEVYDEFVVEITPASEELLEVVASKPSHNSARKIAAIEMNADTDFQDAKTNRRIILPEEKPVEN
jgi:hypothetical protein